MVDIVTLDAPDLAAMLCSRICHDLINPVGAIGNGLDALEDPAQESMRDLAVDLIKGASRQALAKLEFARLAYGASTTAGTEFDTRECERVAQLFYSIEKADLKWDFDPVMLPKNTGKLLMNMLLIASESVFRGGLVTVRVHGEPGKESIEIEAVSDPEKRQKTLIPAGVEAYISGEGEEVTAREIQPFYTGLLARMVEKDLAVSLEGATFRFTARPQSA